MEDPTENAVAQAKWVSTNVTPVLEQPPPARSFEADAETAIFQEDWTQGLSEALRWLADEPFSSRPAVVASFAASVGLEDYSETERIAREGLRANPHHAILLNNLAFALARTRRLDESIQYLREGLLHASAEEYPTLVATEGALAYRAGDVERGQELYERAVAEFLANRQPAAAGLALLFWIEEEALHDPESARDRLREMTSRILVPGDPATRTLMRRIEQRLGTSP